MNKVIFSLAVLIISGVLYGRGVIVPHDAKVDVSYQLQKHGKTEWMSGRETLSGFVTESEMKKEIGRRNPKCHVRILAADPGPDKILDVRYKIMTENKKWENRQMTMTNALTYSMAKNQILAKNPGQNVKVRILSIKKK